MAVPYVNAQQTATPSGDLGTPLESGSIHGEAGLDLKWTPSAGTIDATLNPDFSQIESDVAQITANERFAIFYPEKRPFFLEGINLFSTPIQAVYTRTITSPRFGARGTGKWGELAFTGLVADDRGRPGRDPGPNGSSFANQDETSFSPRTSACWSGWAAPSSLRQWRRRGSPGCLRSSSATSGGV